jgi:GrpB-like predicted nucleotidyltransferase (UPF0157 family)
MWWNMVARPGATSSSFVTACARSRIWHAYEALKIELAAKYANDRASYTAAKKEFIQKILSEGA